MLWKLPGSGPPTGVLNVSLQIPASLPGAGKPTNWEGGEIWRKREGKWWQSDEKCGGKMMESDRRVR